MTVGFKAVAEALLGACWFTRPSLKLMYDKNQMQFHLQTGLVCGLNW